MLLWYTCIAVYRVLKMIKAYKYCIKLTEDQQELLKHQFDAARHIYNRSLALKSYAYKKFGVKLGLKELKGRLPKLRKRHAWLKQADSQVLQQSVINLDTAFKKFFTGLAQYPRFKSKRDRQSIQYPQRVVVDDVNSQIKLSKVGCVKIILHRDIAKGKIKTVTVSKTSTGKYFASVLVDDELAPVEQINEVFEDQFIGIDTGLTDVIYDSNSFHVSNPKYLSKHQRRLTKLQRELSRKTNKSSKRRAVARQRLAKAHERLANTRKDFLHKLSATLVDKNQAIGVETLQVKNLMQNRRLAKSFADSAISSLYDMLKYKIERKGGYFVKVGKFYASTKVCLSCGNKKDQMLLKERVYVCENCGLSISRDYNAALNIKEEAINILSAAGHVVVRRGDTVRPQLIVASAGEASRSLTL